VGEAFERELHSWSEAYAPCRRAAELLSEATQALHSAPEQVSFRSIEGLQQKLTTSQSKARDNSNGHFFELDRKYFGEQLGALREICERYSISTQQGAAVSSEYERARRLAADDAPVAPAVLLASPELRRWARSAKDALGLARIPDPRRRHYREALDDFEAVTGSLRTSSAVQRRLVTGVLGHHLMEAMEEHVLRLAETAHVLYPRTLLNADHESSVEHHAAALSDQAEQARAIPKNLRALYQLLMTGRETQTRIQSLRRSQAEQPSAGVLVVDIFDQAFSAEQLPEAKIKYDKKSSRKVPPAVAASLGLVFGELASNHRVHGKLIGDAELNDEETSIGQRYEVVVGVPAAPNLDRLIDVALGAFQGFSPPNDAVEESSGVGLYLANLAASVVGWNLSLRGQDKLRNMFSIDHELTPEDYRAAHEQVLSNNTICFIVSERRP
jgi:hypothetical protein